MTDAKRDSGAWRKLSRQRREIARANDEACEVCHQPFDWSVHHNSAVSCTVDHPDLIVWGGELLPPVHTLGVRHRNCHGHQGAAASNIRQGMGPGSRGGNPETYVKNGNHTKRTKQRKLRLVLAADTAIIEKNSIIEKNLDQKNSKIKSFSPKRSTPPNPERVSPGHPSLEAGGPRLETPDSPDVVGTLGDEWADWLGGNTDIELRPWQRHVLRKALQIDAEGQFVWREIGISTPRQVGKSWLIRAIAIARCSLAESQSVAHLANNVEMTRVIQRDAYHWAAGNGLEKRSAAGDERLLWPNGSLWFLSSLNAIYGRSAHVALVDEVWDVKEAQIRQGVLPITAARPNSQLWMFSTANAEATSLFLRFRKKAMSGGPGMLLIEWSAPPESDFDDPRVWRAASPWWDRDRERLIASQDPEDRRYQFLNCWPGQDGGEGHWLDGWDGLRPSEGPWDSCVGAVEVAADRSCVGAAIAAARGDGSVDVLSYTGPDLQSALAWLQGYSPWLVMGGMSFRAEVEVGGYWITRPAGVRESGMSTPWLAAAVKRKRIRHDHREATAVEVSRSAISDTEGGPLLSARRSTGPIPTLKAIAWSSWVAATEPAVMPAIY